MSLTNAAELKTVIHGSFTIERVYPSVPEKVFAAFADHSKKRRWFVEGEGFETDSFEMDFRVGGKEQSRFRIADNGPMHGTAIVNDTTYLDIVPNRRIVVAYTMAMHDNRFSASMVTVEILPGEAPSSSRLILTEQGAYFDGADAVKMREAGTRELLDALGKELAREAS